MDWSDVLHTALALIVLITPVLILRFIFNRTRLHWLSSHSTLVSVLVTMLGFGVLGLIFMSYRGHPHYAAIPQGRDVIEQALDEALANGKIAYDIPAEMKEGEAKKVEVRIAKGIDQDVVTALKQHLRDRTQVDDIQVAPFMTVRLNAEKDSFDIQALTQDNQAVTDKTYTTWAWLLTPQQSGEKTLYLSVGTRFKLPGRDEETEFRPLYEKEVKVQVDRIYEAKRFASSNWQWLGGAVVIPLIGFFWRLRRKKPPSAKPPEQRSLIIQP